VKLTRGTVYGAFAVAVALAMGLSLRNGFVYDDLPAIVQNSRVTDPTQWHTIPQSPYWLGTLWRPLTVALYAAQWFLGHGAPWLFHLTSLIGYCAVAVILFRLLEQLGVDRFGAAAAVLLFLAHPVHVEVVANGVGQAEIWVALALVAASLVYLRARQTGTEQRSLPALLACVTLGIMAKEQGFVAPLLLGGAEWLLPRDRQERWPARIRLLVPATALAVLLFVVRGVLLDSTVGESPAIALRALSPIGRVVTFLGVIPEWFRLVVWPLHLQADYGPPGIPVGGAMTLRHWIGLALLVGWVVLFLRCKRRAPVVAFGVFWATIALAPVSNLLTPTGIVMAERVMFVPTIGFAIMAAAMIRREEGRATRGVILAAAVVAWGVMLTARSATRVSTWRTQEGFYADLTIDGSRAYRSWMAAAKYWDDVHDQPRAIADLRHALELWPHDYQVFERLGQMLRQDGRCGEAIPVFTTGLREDPSATSTPLRARLIECLISERHWDAAEQTANDGVALGHEEFRGQLARVRRLRHATDSTSRPP
jgi:hypothetical protein